MRIMIDTNIVISALLFPESFIRVIIDHILQFHTLIISTYSLEEIKKLLERKFRENAKAVNEFFMDDRIVICASPSNKCSFGGIWIRDKKDLPILKSFITSGSDILITGDKDFFTPELAKYNILRPNEFYNQYVKGDISD